MEINRKTADAWISYWENYIGSYDLPSWEQIPDFGIYMEQVVTFLKKCLSYMETSNESDSIITASAINNYVRKKIMPQAREEALLPHSHSLSDHSLRSQAVPFDC